MVEIAWAKNGTPHTLSGSADIIEITDMSSLEFNVLMVHGLNSGSIYAHLRLNNDSGTNYSWRSSSGGGPEATGTTKTRVENIFSNASQDNLAIIYIINISSNEKLVISHSCGSGTTGATNAPSRTEIVGKWANTSVQFTESEIINSQTGSFITDSNLSALGTD